MEDSKILDCIANTIIKEHSYEFKTFDDAKSTITIEDVNIEIVYDRLSTSFYSHNLSVDGYRYLTKKLEAHFSAHDKKEDLKARDEYCILLKFFNNCSLYKGYRIEKTCRPDFIVTGKNRIGIEITALTTPHYKVLDKICKENFGLGKTAEQIHADAFAEHGFKANNYTYNTVCGSTVIGCGTQDVNFNKDIYVDEIIKKLTKYREAIPTFDEFIILCDAESDIEVTSEWDAEDIILRVKNLCSGHQRCTVCILYIDSDTQKFQIGRFHI